MIDYEGLFFDEETIKYLHSLESKTLECENDILHITYVYKPSINEIYDNIVGNYYDIYLVGYANDEKNSGFEVELPQELDKYYHNVDIDKPDIIKKPHLTVSLSKDSEPVHTNKLNFKPLENKIKLKARFGYWIKEEDREYLSFEKYKK